MTLLRRVVGELAYRARHLGRLPVCNLRRDRSPGIGRLCFPLCWRCTGIVLSLLLFHYLYPINLQLITSLLLVAPCAVDGVLQYGFLLESTNPRRFVTGALAGVGLQIVAGLQW